MCAPALAAAALSLLGATAFAATAFTQATVTRTQNRVEYGDATRGASSLRPAQKDDNIKDSAFLQTGGDSRAELRYPDGTLVRVGQNTVFSFDADRTLSLAKGTMIFFMPKGQGGGTIKTPSLTAAITGTTGKVSTNMIVILEGEVTLKPNGPVVHAGEFARREPDGSVTVAKFDASKAGDGALMNFNGPIGEIDESLLRQENQPPVLPDFLRSLDMLDRTQNLPGSVDRLNPLPKDPPPANREDTKIKVPPPTSTNGNKQNAVDRPTTS